MIYTVCNNLYTFHKMCMMLLGITYLTTYHKCILQTGHNNKRATCHNILSVGEQKSEIMFHKLHYLCYYAYSIFIIPDTFNNACRELGSPHVTLN